MTFLQDYLKNIQYILKWIFISIILGIICGIVGAAFHHAIDFVTEIRGTYSWLVYLMPIGGCIIVLIYQINGLHHQPGTNEIFKSVKRKEFVPIVLAPTIFLTTVITHLVGGSSGREGAALQLGGSIAAYLGKWLKLSEEDTTIIIMGGMAAVFSALFGTPITATVFTMEVITVGQMHYSAFVPCLFSAFVAGQVSQFLGCTPTYFDISHLNINYDVLTLVKLIGVAFIVSVVSILFVQSMHFTHHLFKDKFKNPYMRVAAGSFVLIILTLIIGPRYLGGGMNIVEKTFANEALSYDFVMKILFTAITIGCGFKGGEIVPTFFIGSTLGVFVGRTLGIEPGLIGAIGMVAMFCCVVNCPLASAFLAIEVFGAHNLMAFVIVIALCYVFSDYFSLYSAQEFKYSKIKPSTLKQ